MRTTVTPTGLAAHLVDIRTGGQAARDPLRGGLYENLVILDIPKGPFAQCNTKPAPSRPARTRALQEIDTARAVQVSDISAWQISLTIAPSPDSATSRADDRGSATSRSGTESGEASVTGGDRVEG